MSRDLCVSLRLLASASFRHGIRNRITPRVTSVGFGVLEGCCVNSIAMACVERRPFGVNQSKANLYYRSQWTNLPSDCQTMPGINPVCMWRTSYRCSPQESHLETLIFWGKRTKLWNSRRFSTHHQLHSRYLVFKKSLGVVIARAWCGR